MRNYFTKIKVEILGADVIIENADISIEYTKTSEQNPNYCDLIIYNMSDDTYNRINNRANSARVYADIDGQGYALIFAGDLRNMIKWKKATNSSKSKTSSGNKTKNAKVHYHEAPIRREESDTDIATIISLEDGRKVSFFNNHISRSYKGEVTNKYILDDILRYVKQQDSNIKISSDANTLKEYTYPKGVSFNGSLISVLTSICKTGDAYCTIQDDVILVSSTQIDTANKAYTYVLNGDNCPTPEQGTDKELVILAPFIPNLNPFNFLKLEFKDYLDLFQVKKIVSKIDNFGESNESKITVSMDN